MASVGAAGFRRQELFVKFQETKQTSLSHSYLLEKIILFVFSISFHLTAGKAGCSLGRAPGGCRFPPSGELLGS